MKSCMILLFLEVQLYGLFIAGYGASTTIPYTSDTTLTDFPANDTTNFSSGVTTESTYVSTESTYVSTESAYVSTSLTTDETTTTSLPDTCTPDSGLSQGALIGIGCFLFVVGLSIGILATLLVCKHRKASEKSNNLPSTHQLQAIDRTSQPNAYEDVQSSSTASHGNTSAHHSSSSQRHEYEDDTASHVPDHGHTNQAYANLPPVMTRAVNLPNGNTEPPPASCGTRPRQYQELEGPDRIPHEAYEELQPPQTRAPNRDAAFSPVVDELQKKKKKAKPPASGRKGEVYYNYTVPEAAARQERELYANVFPK